MDDEERLDEWTIQMAAGADPLTAWASLPSDPKPQQQPSPWPAVAVVIAVTAIFALWLLMS